MYLICHKDSPYYDSMPCELLQPEDEIFILWGQDIQEWHDRYWSPERYHRMTVNTGSMLQHYLEQPGRWAVAPMSVVHAISHNPNLTFHTFREPPSPRICYMLTNRYLNAIQRAVIEAFQQELSQYVEANTDICSFEEWMLKT